MLNKCWWKLPCNKVVRVCREVFSHWSWFPNHEFWSSYYQDHSPWASLSTSFASLCWNVLKILSRDALVKGEIKSIWEVKRKHFIWFLSWPPQLLFHEFFHIKISITLTNPCSSNLSMTFCFHFFCNLDETYGSLLHTFSLYIFSFFYPLFFCLVKLRWTFSSSREEREEIRNMQKQLDRSQIRKKSTFNLGKKWGEPKLCGGT